MPETISVIIMSPEEVVWEGKAKALSSSNAEGAFDILPNHANFISLIRDAEVSVLLQNKGESRVFSFEQAVLFFQENTAKIYIHTHGDVESSENDKV